MESNTEANDHYFMTKAITEAKKSLQEGGIPIGAVLVADGRVLGRGHNRLIQNNSVILHGEMDCIESAGRLKGLIIINQLYTLLYHLVPCVLVL